MLFLRMKRERRGLKSSSSPKLISLSFAVLLLAVFGYIASAAPTNISSCQDLNETGAYYALTQNVNSAGTCFNVTADNITLDGQGYTINYSQSTTGYAINITNRNNITIKNLVVVQGNSSINSATAIYTSGTTNSTILNNTITTSSTGSTGIYITSYSSSGNNLLYNRINTAGCGGGIYIYQSNSHYLSNNNVTLGNSCSGYGIITLSYSSSNTLIDNILSGGNGPWGIDLDNGANSNSIIGGSITAPSLDYYLAWSITTSNFTNTNFTAPRKIQFAGDNTSQFNYNNETNGNIWLKTKVSATTTLTRTLVTWSNTSMKWNDTNSTSGIMANYTLTGLLTNTQYNVYNTSGGTQTNPYTLQADSAGKINFNISLNGNTEVLVNSLGSDSSPVVSALNSPANNSNFTTGTLWLNATGYDDFNITAMELNVWNSTSLVNQTNVTNPANNTMVGVQVTLTNGTYKWNYRAYDNASQTGWYASNYTFTIDGIAPTSNTPANVSYTQNSSATIGWILYDNYVGGNYTVYRNGTVQNQSNWQNNTNLNIRVNTSTQGTWNYTITYNDSLGNNGNPNTVIINITGDLLAPKYSLNSTNSTIAGASVRHSLYWQEDVELSGYIFSFDNGNGTFYNDSWVAFMGIGNWSNVSKTVNSTVGAIIRWRVYANDTSNNWNASAEYSYVTTNNPPTYSNIGTNNTIANQSTLFYAYWTDDVGLSAYIFSTNNSGAWENQTYSFTGIGNWSNYTLTLNATAGLSIGYRFYANDTNGQWNDTGILSFVLSGPSTCNSPVSGNWTVNNTQICQNTIITLNGNLSIQSNSNLTFQNVTLKINSSFNGEFGIKVSGGMFYIDDSSNITTNIVNKSYFFNVLPGSNITIKNSYVDYVGWNTSGYNTAQNSLWIESSICDIENNVLTGPSVENTTTIILYNVTSCKIYNNTISVFGKNQCCISTPNSYVVYLLNSSNNNVSYNNLNVTNIVPIGNQPERSGGIQGIGLNSSSNNIIYGNTIRTPNQGSAGVYVVNSINNTIQNNNIHALQYYSIYIVPTATMSYYNHNISNNTVLSNKTFLYYFNISNSVLNTTNAGEIFVANSTNITLRNIYLWNTGGIYLAHVYNSNISNYTDNRTLVSLSEAYPWTMLKATLYPSLALYYSSNNSVSDLTVNTGGRYDHAIALEAQSNNNTFNRVNVTTNSIMTYGYDGHTNSIYAYLAPKYTKFYNFNVKHYSPTDYPIEIHLGSYNEIINITYVSTGYASGGPQIQTDNFVMRNANLWTNSSAYFNICDQNALCIKGKNITIYDSILNNSIALHPDLGVNDYTGNVGNNHLINVTFDISKNNATLNISNGVQWGASSTNSFYRDWYLDVYVNDSNGNSINGANITVVMANSTQVFTENTTSDGTILQKTLTEYFQNRTDTIYYTNYTVNVSKSGYAAQSVQVNLTGNKQLVFTLQSQGGGTFYVRTDGNDTCTGINNQSYVQNPTDCAWQTVQKATSTLTAGQTARMQTGTYNEQNIITNNSGTAGNYITFVGDGSPLINGMDTILNITKNYWNVSSVVFNGTTSKQICTATLCSQTNGTIIPVVMIYGNNTMFTFNKVNFTMLAGLLNTNPEGGGFTPTVYVYSSNNSTFLNNTFYSWNVNSPGIALTKSSNNTLKNNTFDVRNSYSVFVGEQMSNRWYASSNTEYDNHNIDTSNLDYKGRLIYYYYNITNTVLELTNPSEIFISNSVNISLKNISTSNADGIIFNYVNNSVISNYTRVLDSSDTGVGIYSGLSKCCIMSSLYLHYSVNNIISNINFSVGGRHNYGLRYDYSSGNNTVDGYTYNTIYYLNPGGYDGHNDAIDIAGTSNGNYFKNFNIKGTTWGDYPLYLRANNLTFMNGYINSSGGSINIIEAASGGTNWLFQNVSFASWTNSVDAIVFIGDSVVNNVTFKDSSFSRKTSDKLFQIYTGTTAGSLNLINTTLENKPMWINRSGFDIYRQWYLDVYVNDSNGALQSANVTILINNGTQAFTGLTDSGGNIQRQTLTEYMQNISGKYYWTNYTVNVSKSGYFFQSTQVNLTSSKSMAFTLQSSDGPSGGITLIGDTIYVYTGRLTSYTEIINNVSLPNDVNATWLNKNIYVNDTNTSLSINNSDTNWLKINTTGAVYYIKSIGGLIINNTKITSWNLTANSESQNVDNVQRSYIFVDHSGGSTKQVTIQNSNISYLGDSVGVSGGLGNRTGLVLYNVANGLIENHTSYGMWSGIEVDYSTNTTINNANVYNTGSRTGTGSGYGIVHAGGSNNKFYNIFINGSGRSGIDFTGMEHDFEYKNITVGYAGHVGVDAHGGYNGIIDNVTAHHSTTENFLITSVYNLLYTNIVSYNSNGNAGFFGGGDSGNQTGFNESRNIQIINYTTYNETRAIYLKNIWNATLFNVNATNDVAGIFLEPNDPDYGHTFVNNSKIIDTLIYGTNGSDNDYGKDIQMYNGEIKLINVNFSGGGQTDFEPTDKTRSYYVGNRTLSYYADIWVKDSFGQNVSGATITITPNATTYMPAVTDGFGEEKTTFTTGSDGHTPLPENRSNSVVLAKYYQHGTTSTADYQKAYLSYNITVSKAGYQTNSTAVVPVSSWYRQDTNTPQNTILIILTDITPPVITVVSPTNATSLSSGTTSTWINITTDENATCRYNLTNSSFVYVDGTNFTNTGGSNHSFLYSGLTDNTAYGLYYLCNDTYGNVNSEATHHTFSVSSAAVTPATPSGGGGGGGGTTTVQNKTNQTTKNTTITIPTTQNTTNTTIVPQEPEIKQRAQEKINEVSQKIKPEDLAAKQKLSEAEAAYSGGEYDKAYSLAVEAEGLIGNGITTQGTEPEKKPYLVYAITALVIFAAGYALRKGYVKMNPKIVKEKSTEKKERVTEEPKEISSVSVDGQGTSSSGDVEMDDMQKRLEEVRRKLRE